MDSNKAYFEHRIGLVMYGGVSLAIYMNGIAQEFLNLVLATSTNDKGEHLLVPPPEEPKQFTTYLDGTRSVYRRMAELIAEKEGLYPKFIVDILSGTSAGGLNGMFLAKSLAEKKSFEPLRSLWINEGEIEQLLDREESYADMPHLPRRPSRSLLNSRRMYAKLLGALEEMDRTPLGLPDDADLVKELDLHMTATDLVGRPIPVNLGIEEFIPRISDEPDDNAEMRRFQLEKEHRVAFHFRYAPDEIDPYDPKKGIRNDFKPSVNPFLAFVGRCTSSIVPAFEPMRLKDAVDILAQTGHIHRAGDWKQFYGTFWRSAKFLSPPQDDLEKNVTKEAKDAFVMRPFGDGGYLDNRPFGHAFTSLKQRRALRPVRRMVFYVEPHPERNIDVSRSMEVPSHPLSAIKHGQIAATLGRAQNINERVREMRRLADQSERTRRAMELHHNGQVTPLSPPIDLYYESTLDQLAAVLSDLLGFGDDSLVSALRSLIGVSLKIAFLELLEKQGVHEPRKEFTNRIGEFHEWAHNHFNLAYSNRIFEFIRTGLEQAALTKPRSSQSGVVTMPYGQAVDRIEGLYGQFWSQTTISRYGPDKYSRPEDSFVQMRVALDEYRLRPESADQILGSLDDLQRQILGSLLDLRISVGEVCYVQVRTTDDRSTTDIPTAIRRAEEVLIDGIEEGLEKEPSHRKQKIVADNDFRRNRPATIRKLIDGLRQIMSLEERQEAYKNRMAELQNEHIAFEKFVHYDAATFPLLYQAGMADSYALDLVRVSPVDARSLTREAPDPVAKLAGIGLGHFAAFLSRPGRILDIVWGRLDAAEVILKTYLSQKQAEELLPEAQIAIIVSSLESVLGEPETLKGQERLPDEQNIHAIERLQTLARLVVSKVGGQK